MNLDTHIATARRATVGTSVLGWVALDNKTIDRFWSKADRSGNCWTWQGSINNKGYGQFFSQRRMLKAHRVAYLIGYGIDPKEQNVLHRCDNPRCVRPDHLFLGTQTDNMQDMVAKKRNFSVTKPERLPRGDRNGTHTHPERQPRGENHRNAKLTDDIVRAIRIRWAAGGIRQQDLADEYGIAKERVFSIIHRRAWKHVE